MSSSLKILQLVHTLDPTVGGVAASVLALSRGLTRRGHKIDILVLDDPAAAWIKDACHAEGPSRTGGSRRRVDLTVHALGSGLTSYRYLRELMPWLRKNGGD